MTIEILKTVAAWVIRSGLYIFCVFPIRKNKIIFIPSNGHYYCNLKYIYQRVKEEKNDWDCIWASRGEWDDTYPEGAKYVSIHNISFLYHHMTASVVIFNDGIPSWLVKRKGQVWINTWHGGGAYKRVAAVFCDNPNYWKKQRTYYIFDRIDYMVSACRKFTEGFETDVRIPAKYLSIGMPRNDIFFSEEKMREAAERVRACYGVSPDCGIVMYAPTFRDDGMMPDLDTKKLLAALETRFHKKFVLFVRSHPHVAKDIFEGSGDRERIFDVSAYADMQELLCAADVLITDYSSSVWDFSFTGKPCFLYATDLEHYLTERNFYTPIREWPFSLAERNIELQNNILKFDEKKYSQLIREHHESLGSYENGTASRQMCRLIGGICNEKKTGAERNTDS